MSSMQRMIQVLRGQTALAQKVFFAIPLTDAWTIHQIRNEVRRQGVAISDNHKLHACLESLRDAGLLKSGPGFQLFRREHAITPADLERTKERVEGPGEQPVAEVVDKPEAPETVFEQLAKIGGRARLIADQLNTLADDIEMAALSVDQRSQQLSAGEQKVKKIQELMRELAGA